MESQILNKQRIQKLKKALRTSNKPQLNECNDWNILGRHGEVYLDNTYWYVLSESRLPSYLKLKLSSFMNLWQGDCVYRTDKFPDPEQAEIIREVVGLKKKRTISPVERERLAKMGEKSRYTHGPAGLN